MDLHGQVAFVTGGGRGMGRSFAVALAEAGADLVVCDVVRQNPAIPIETGRSGDLEETKALVEDLGRRCIAEIGDVRDHVAMNELVARAERELGPVSVLVANAGVGAPIPIQDISYETWTSVVDVNLTGVFNAMSAVASRMIERRQGRIVAISSGSAKTGEGSSPAYTASKWGVIGLVKSAAVSLGPHNITVNAILPGHVETPMMRNDVIRRLYVPGVENPTDEDVDRMIIESGTSHMPISVLPPEEIANAVMFLVSDQAKYITGSALEVSAGHAANHS